MEKNVLKSSSQQVFVVVICINFGVRQWIFVKNQIFLGLAVYCEHTFLVLREVCLLWSDSHGL